MLYRNLADLVLLLHLLFIVFVLAGGLLAFRWPNLVWVHLPAVLWGAAIEVAGWICPLTPLENHFRQLAGEAGYAGGFIEHYLLAAVYPAGLTREIQMALGFAVLALNLLVYGVWWRWRRRAG
ncbi:MAG: hypothetical protein A2Z44_04495 [Betaproteobacteria bacterium RBG_19FT_COMBO_58_11]|nr:MAG: hypothetical protein A2Z44_04495 [Betaproteobacteria bacterium RBG_19FT_COMBO_58_11]